MKTNKLPKNYGRLLNKNYFLLFLLVIIAFLSGFIIERNVRSRAEVRQQTKTASIQNTSANAAPSEVNITKLQGEVIKKGYVFKIKWGDLGKKMVEDGVIDKQKLAKAVTGTDNLPQNMDKYLSENQNSIELSQDNAQFWVDVLWGLGLANNNLILNSGPMVEGGNTGGFASIAGYTIGLNQPMNIYSKYQYINLSKDQENEVYEIASNVYRPCCGNSTAFPDCNHGMAALGLIELMVSQNFSKDDIYKTVLAFNTYWFPQIYLDTAYYFQQNGRDYSEVSAQELLSKTFSSAMGYQVVQKKVGAIKWPALQNGGSCGA